MSCEAGTYSTGPWVLNTDRYVWTLNTGLVTQSLTAGHKSADVVEPIYKNEAN
jgi:hypothetical protein